MLNQVFEKTKSLLEMIRFSHTLFALPFASLAAVMAWHVRKEEWLLQTSYFDAVALKESVIPQPLLVMVKVIRWQEVAGILICMVGARSAAMAFNRLVDRQIDALNPRTRSRHLPAGLLSVPAVILFTLVSAAIFFAGTLLFLPNWLPIALSVPVLLFLCLYSYTKRFTSLAHFWLGAALMLAPICAWIALRGEVLVETPIDIFPALVLSGAVLMWVSGFDIIYACQDYAFDTQAKLKSVPARLGIVGALRLAAVCHLLMVGLLIALPLLNPQLGLGWIYGFGIFAVALLLIYEHSIVSPDDLSRVNVAFFNVNSVVSIGLFLVTSVDLLW